VDHFNGIIKEDNRAIIVEVVKMATYFPSFVSKEDNVNLM
jgi:hypothetical protein